MRTGLAAFVLLSLIMAAAVGLLSSRSAGHKSSKILVGTPDGTPGLIIHTLLHGHRLQNMEAVAMLEGYALKDCCAGTSEWALGSERLDAAVMCPDAARRLEARDPRFETLGPSLLNSDVLVVRGKDPPRKIGIAQRRDYQEKLLRETCGGGCSILHILPAGLPYALARGAVDGIVVDALRGISLEGKKVPLGNDRKGALTHVLVARREFRSGPLFAVFMRAYEEAVADLNDDSLLLQEVERYRGMPWTEGQIGEWKRLKVRFVSPRGAAD